MAARTTISRAARDGEQLVVRYRRPDDTWQAALIVPAVLVGAEWTARRKVRELRTSGKTVEVMRFTPKI